MYLSPTLYFTLSDIVEDIYYLLENKTISRYPGVFISCEGTADCSQ